MSVSREGEVYLVASPVVSGGFIRVFAGKSFGGLQKRGDCSGGAKKLLNLRGSWSGKGAEGGVSVRKHSHFLMTHHSHTLCLTVPPPYRHKGTHLRVGPMVFEDPTDQALPWQGAFTQDDVTGFRDFAHAHALREIGEKKQKTCQSIFIAKRNDLLNGMSPSSERGIERRSRRRRRKKWRSLYRK